MNLSKREAADHLLQAASAALLDMGDAVSAIVLAGAAEDIYWGLLAAAAPEKTPARDEVAHHVIQTASALFPHEPPLSLKAARRAIRTTYNWLRHNDDPDEPQVRTFDEATEAAATIERAMENLFRLTGVEHPRMQELLTQVSMRT